MAAKMQTKRAVAGSTPAAKKSPVFTIRETTGSTEEKEANWKRFENAAVAVLVAAAKQRARREQENG
ncbi:hypothetical protein RMSM_00981 [Rhodopirellula maiorica SM1]|uniref:Uncharacterized protein n=1 Tax=Rhodopirellula maiorica SM1 TaxID=1265738 RepID=M5S7E1_9BACT|nr:hypothetical protein RMSM_00981 [Rhodopirellula maiorica SM1]